MKRITDPAILQDSLSAAQSLLGKLLVHEHPQGKTVGRIVETEAYHQDDPASHSFGGRTERNSPMFKAAGTAYVYLSYGIHHCINVTTGERGHGQAVLLRALEPVSGLELMRQRRGRQPLHDLCSGPAKLTHAMGIDFQQNGLSLLSPPLYLAEDELSSNASLPDIIAAPRIGISKARDELLRFYLRDNPFISRK